MNLWNITIGEPLPTDGDTPRLYRGGIFSRTAAERGHRVVWWTSTFNHHETRFRWHQDTHITVSDGLAIQALHGRGYRRNVSVARLINHWQLSRRFDLLQQRYDRPDLILCSFPDIFLSHAAVRFGVLNRVPVVLDVRDLWPDIFLELVPKPARVLARMATARLFALTSRAFAEATAVTAITEPFLSWGLGKARRARGAWDRVFPMAYSRSDVTDTELAKGARFWKSEYGLDGSQPVVCFLGALGKQFDITTVIEAARDSRCHQVVFVMCGAGEKLDSYRQQAAGLSNVVFPGWVGKEKLLSLMRISLAGLAPYRNGPNFTGNIPNKPIEYMSSGLPVLTCLGGELKRLLEDHQCGLYYEPASVTSLAAAVSRLIDQPSLRSRLSENALALFERSYEAGNVYGEFVDYCEELVARFE